MRTIAFMNAKGGTAKTASAVNIAAALAELGQRVLVVDLDPQASASAWLGVADGGRGLLDAFTSNVNLSDLVTPSTAEGVDLIPSSLWLATTERALAGEPGIELVFRGLLEQLPADRWAYVLVDCPPALGFFSVSALAACREVVVPVEMSPDALKGVVALSDALARVKARLNPGVGVAGYLVCRYDGRQRLSREVVASLDKAFGEAVLRTRVRENVAIKEARGHALPVTAYAPSSAGAEDYRSVTKELEKLGGKGVKVSKRKRLPPWPPRTPRKGAPGPPRPKEWALRLSRHARPHGRAARSGPTPWTA
jgi:chromosome partitioning protein